jgi:CDP-glycerol glycerophosphotransferase (TagB/SpsB family)
VKKYLLFVSQTYSFAILQPLYDAIVDRGDSAAWFLDNVSSDHVQQNNRLLTSVKEVKEYNPCAVFVPGNWVPDFFPGIKVEVFHGFNVHKRAGSKQDHFRIRGWFDLYCTQGPDTTEPFKKLAQKHRYFKVVETGWPKLDPLFKDDVSDNLRQQIGSDKPIVLYASTFSPAMTSAPVLFEHIKRLSQNSKWHWLITLHPKTPAELVTKYKSLESSNVTFKHSDDGILPLLKAADVMLCDTSSIMLEFLVQKKPVVTFKSAIRGPQLINIDEPRAIEAALTEALTRPEKLMQEIENYANHIHPYRDGQSSLRVLKAVDEFIANNEMSHLKNKPLNLGRKVQIRKRMKYYRIR